MRSLGFIAALAVLLGCVLGLAARFRAPAAPSVHAQILSSAYDRVTPGTTTLAGLQSLGFDTRGAQRMSELGMIEQFIRGDSVDFDALDGTVKDCLIGRARCSGYVFSLSDMPGARAVLVTVKDRVAYKMLSGEVSASRAVAAGSPAGH